MLGFVQDGLQHYLADIGPLGPDKGKGGKFLILPPGFQRKPARTDILSPSPPRIPSCSLYGDFRLKVRRIKPLR